ncbi:MAG: DNA polymerase III subunit epsilon [Paracoccaceae bacterium]
MREPAPREIVLDTETTGLDPSEGHRIVEIAAVELRNGLPTGRAERWYINPERPMPADAYQVHGLGDDFLRNQPKFAEIADAFLGFIAGDPLVIHNAAFDMAMLNAELTRLGRPRLPDSRAVDTLALAREAFPGAQVSLDALCRRFGVDNSTRDKHGALLDCELLADVYLGLQGGRQRGLGLGTEASRQLPAGEAPADRSRARPRPQPLAPLLTEAERARHAAFIAEFGDASVWARYPTD